MKNEQIKELALANGFQLKAQANGHDDLNPYVYDFAQALINAALDQAKAVYQQEAVTADDTHELDIQINHLKAGLVEEHCLSNSEEELLDILVAKSMKLGELYERMKWQEAKPKYMSSLSLTCEELKQAYEYGAPDDTAEQLETEMVIELCGTGHSGPGLYCWYSDYPDEGSILLGEGRPMPPTKNLANDPASAVVISPAKIHEWYQDQDEPENICYPKDLDALGDGCEHNDIMQVTRYKTATLENVTMFGVWTFKKIGDDIERDKFVLCDTEEQAIEKQQDYFDLLKG
ncbi:hypothetical protein F965_00047 [Acinetobacter schindleri NIPH 900]|uniref:DUF551 domain-containing protein n=1 Tax=Acinetobacter schindleri NIPH 900 TaxID=1217675 RepID=N8WRS7_9GAMM|nr:hypothetical protein [Acinetobacter schindleri]ENV14701.1 hypothetical protein F965_00047 [Acinetobacter schindleri NIPH 900]